MLKIYETILQLYKEKFFGSSREFKEGFRMALFFMKEGLKREYQFNEALENERLRRLLRKTNVENTRLINILKDYEIALGKKSLITLRPINHFKQYEVETIYGEFDVVINAGRETFLTLWYKFLGSTTYNSCEECKIKFIGFLQQGKSKGIIVYKDLKTAKKEISNDSRKNNKRFRG